MIHDNEADYTEEEIQAHVEKQLNERQAKRVPKRTAALVSTTSTCACGKPVKSFPSRKRKYCSVTCARAGYKQWRKTTLDDFNPTFYKEMKRNGYASKEPTPRKTIDDWISRNNPAFKNYQYNEND